ncbi:hypothetical protein D3C81_1385100 [compost metagenome]
MGQQDLRGVPAMLGETGLPGLDQPHLPHRRRRLQLVHGARTAVPAQAAHPGGNGAGRHQHQFHPRIAQGHHLFDPDRHGRTIQPATIGRQQCTTDLHHPALRASHLVPHIVQP